MGSLAAALNSNCGSPRISNQSAGDTASGRRLRDAYGRITDPKVRDDIMFHVATHPNAETNKWLVSVVVDPKQSIEQRKNALFHLTSRKTATGDELADPFLELFDLLARRFDFFGEL